MRTLLALLSLTAFLGCSPHRVERPPPPKSNSKTYGDLRPAGDTTFSADEQRIVEAARSYLQNRRGKPVDARYRVERTSAGYEVFAMFVGSYENGRPLYYPGGHGVVYLRADGTVDRKSVV